MVYTFRQVGAWQELVAIARSEIILDKIEAMLTGLDIPRSEWPWMLWEELTEKNGEALHTWLENGVEVWLWPPPFRRGGPSEGTGSEEPQQ